MAEFLRSYIQGFVCGTKVSPPRQEMICYNINVKISTLSHAPSPLGEGDGSPLTGTRHGSSSDILSPLPSGEGFRLIFGGRMGHFLPTMVLEIVSYGHPALRAKGRKISEVNDEILQLVEDMLETMEAASGVGLAAQQVGIPMQVCVVDITGVKDRPSEMWIDGKAVDHEDFMPLILINPKITLSGRERSGNEGCLSFPGLSGDVSRHEKVKVHALDEEGEVYDFEASGLLARAIQHEFDHLQGVLYIDRMGQAERKRLAGDLEELLARSQG